MLSGRLCQLNNSRLALACSRSPPGDATSAAAPPCLPGCLTSCPVGELKVSSMRAASLSFLLTWLMLRGGSLRPASQPTSAGRFVPPPPPEKAPPAAPALGVGAGRLLLFSPPASTSLPWCMPPLPPMLTAIATAAARSAAALRGGLLVPSARVSAAAAAPGCFRSLPAAAAAPTAAALALPLPPVELLLGDVCTLRRLPFEGPGPLPGSCCCWALGPCDPGGSEPRREGRMPPSLVLG